MQILFFSSLWGMDNLSLSDALTKIKSSGYDGVEYGPLTQNKKNFLTITKDLDLKIIAQQHKADGDSFKSYQNSFVSEIESFLDQNPLFINSQTGKDFYSFEQNAAIIEIANNIANHSGIPIYHETHRGKFPYSVKETMPFLAQFPDIVFTADFSHFCNVSESFLENQSKNLNQIIKNSKHIHARVGHTQSAQVTDPRLEIWKDALQKHIRWWDKIVNHQKEMNAPYLTITPEFGAFPYMTHLPNGEPIANQWEINLYMKNLLKKRYGVKLKD